MAATPLAAASADTPVAAGLGEPPVAEAMASLMSTPTITGVAPVPGTAAFVWVRNSQGRQSVIVGEAGSGRPLLSFEADDGRILRNLGVTPDGAHIYFVRSGAPEARLPSTVEPARTELYVISSKDGVVEAKVPATPSSLVSTTDGRWLFYTEGSAVWRIDLRHLAGAPMRMIDIRGLQGGLSPSPDGQRLAFVSNRSIYRRGSYSFVCVYELAQNRLTYMSPGLGLDQDPVWSPDSRRIAFLRAAVRPRSYRFSDFRAGPPFSILVADATTGKGAPVFTADPGPGSVFSPLSTPPDYDNIYVRPNLFWMTDDRIVFPWERTGWRQLYSVASSGAEPARQLTFGRFEVSGASASTDRKALAVTANVASMRPQVFRLPALGGAMVPVGEGGMHRSPAWCGDDRCILTSAWSDLVPASFQVTAESGASRPLDTATLDRSRMSEARVSTETFRFKARDGETIEGVLYRPRRPAGSKAESYPLIVQAHGGSRFQSFPGRSYDATDALPYLMARRGFVYAAINYRSSLGYGANFREPLRYGGKSGGGGDIDDFVDLLTYLRRDKTLDRARVGVFGISYGGYLVGNLLARHSDRFAAGVSISGVGDWVREMESDTGGVLNFNVDQRRTIEALAYRSSAISAVSTWRSPILLIHGDADADGHMEADIELWTALSQRGVPVETMVIPNGTHTFDRWQDRVDVNTAVIQYFERMLRRRAGSAWLGSSPARGG